jgi:hypothetical protein
MITCSGCQIKKEIGDFSKDKSRSNGIDPTCKECKKTQRIERKKQRENIIIPLNKKCSCCNTLLDSKFFDKKPGTLDGLHSECQTCKKKKRIIKKKENMNKKLPEDYKKTCSKCSLTKNKCKFYINVYSTDGINTICSDCQKIMSNIWRNENLDKIKKYRQSAYPKSLEQCRKRRLYDNKYKVTLNLRSRFNCAIKSKGTKSKKFHKTLDLIGCTPEFLIIWLEYQFNSKMSWSNYGKYWHIDHVIPCAFFNLDLEEEQFECFNWRNCRPCKASENISKNDKIQPFQILLQEMKVHYYEQHNQIAGIT